MRIRANRYAPFLYARNCVYCAYTRVCFRFHSRMYVKNITYEFICHVQFLAFAVSMRYKANPVLECARHERASEKNRAQ